MSTRPKKASAARIRYAVVGLGHIVQTAVLPAFAHAKENSELVALVSDDPVKLAELGERYGIDTRVDYERYDDLLDSGEVDAVYLGLPNHLHAEYAIRAAERGVHVLTEKPMAVTEADCRAMIAAADEHGVRLMTAYRLHFEAANLEAIRLARGGEIGDPRVFSAVFGYVLEDPDNIRARADAGGGALLDIGVYCINAARHLFAEEPVEAFAWQARTGQDTVRDADETVAATLLFPGGRLAQFSISFGIDPVAWFSLNGTKGSLCLDNAFEYVEPIEMSVVHGGQERTKSFPPRDQFAPELIHFSTCVIEGRDPQPDGYEGMADVIVVEAIKRSLVEGRPVPIAITQPPAQPDPRLEMRKPKVEKAETVHTESPSGD